VKGNNLPAVTPHRSSQHCFLTRKGKMLRRNLNTFFSTNAFGGIVLDGYSFSHGFVVVLGLFSRQPFKRLIELRSITFYKCIQGK
jgi:hypothetical protein